jgi:hypothetical protein
VLTGFAAGQSSPPPKQAPPKEPPPAAKTETATTPHKRLVVDLSGFELGDPNKARKERALLGATRGGSARLPILLAPELSKYYGAAPLLSWLYPGRSEGFEIVIRDEDDNEVLRQKVSTTEYRLSATTPRLQAGKPYYWSVQSFPPLLEPGVSDVAGFVVVSADERQQIDRELAAIASDTYQDGLARAEVFTQHRLWYDAIGAYRDLITRFPDRGDLFEKRGMIYAQIESTRPLADADFARADELKAPASH